MLGEFLKSVIDFLEHHEWIVAVLFGLSLTTVVATLFFVPWAIVRIPSDYFAHRQPPPTPWDKLHPVLRVVTVVAKNLIGIVLFLAGVLMAMPLVPGPGIITVLVGLALVDIPGKRALERRIVKQPRVFAALNRLRTKYDRPPLEKPD